MKRALDAPESLHDCKQVKRPLSSVQASLDTTGENGAATVGAADGAVASAAASPAGPVPSTLPFRLEAAHHGNKGLRRTMEVVLEVD